MPVIPALSKRRRKDCSRLEGSLHFKVSSSEPESQRTFSKQNKNKDVFVNVKPARWLCISRKKKTHFSHSLSQTLLSKSEFAWVLARNIEVRGYFWKLGLSFPDMCKQVNSAACWAIYFYWTYLGNANVQTRVNAPGNHLPSPSLEASSLFP